MLDEARMGFVFFISPQSYVITGANFHHIDSQNETLLDVHLLSHPSFLPVPPLFCAACAADYFCDPLHPSAVGHLLCSDPAGHTNPPVFLLNTSCCLEISVFVEVVFTFKRIQQLEFAENKFQLHLKHVLLKKQLRNNSE